MSRRAHHRPRIGITCDFASTTDRRGTPIPRYTLSVPYVRSIERAGGLPFLLPFLSLEHAEAALDLCDGLVVSGGDFDVPPSFYGETQRPKCGQTLEDRSAYERALCQGALRRDLPVLGICGGLQILNVTLGGSLYQDLSERDDTAEHQQPQDRREPHHPVLLAAGSRLANACGTTRLETNSTHHQMINRLGTGLVAVGHAPDGVIEAIEHTTAAFAVGVQWHPEWLDVPEQLAVYRAVVEAAAR